MSECPHCRQENREGALFCRRCGRPVGRACPLCAQPNAADAAFCDRCGASLGAAPAPPRSAPAEAPAGAYTPPHLREVFGDRGAIQGERKEVIVLFADVSGFTSLSERIDPEAVHEVMNGCFEILTGEVHRFGGTVNQYTGDGIMALFGAPKAMESAPRDSIRAALAMQRRLLEYARRLEAERGIRFQMRIGLNGGEVVVGAIGDRLRMDYTAMGDTTNLAARLQAAAGPGEILVSEGLFRLTRDWFRFEDLGEKTFKGKAAPQRAYRVLGRGKVSTRIEAAALRGLIALRERGEVLDSLMRIYAEVRRGRGQIVALAGEAGIGKSRVVYELKEALKRAGPDAPLCFSASATRYDRNAPYSFLRRLLRAYAAASAVYCPVDGADDEGLWREIVLARAAALLEEGADVDAIRGLIGGVSREEDCPACDPRTGFDALRTLFVRESRDRPLVVAADNMRDVEPSSLEFLEMLAGGLAAARILLLSVHRPGFENPWASQSNFHQITLPPLSPEAGEEMIREILGGPASAQLLAAVRPRAQGNPFFIEEMVRGMRETGAIRLEGGEWRLKAPEGTIRLPRTIQDVVLTRLDALPPRLREILQTAAVIGPRFDYGLLQRVLPAAGDLDARLLELQDMELVYAAEGDPQGEWGFANRLIQELTYKEMLRSRLAPLHERVGYAIEAMGPEAVEQNLDRLAYHFQSSDALERAAHYLVRAGRRAYAMLAYPQAASRLEQGLIFMESLKAEEAEKFLIERIHVRGDLALTLLALGENERRIESLLGEMREMAERAEDWGQVAMADMHLCTLRFRQGMQDAVVECAERAIGVARRAEADEPLFRAHFALASAYRLKGRFREAIEEGGRALALYEERIAGRGPRVSELANVFVELLVTLAVTHVSLGEADRGEAWFERAWSYAGESRNPVLAHLIRFYGIMAMQVLGRWEEAERAAEEILAEMEGLEFPFAHAGVVYLAGLAKIHLGRVEEGLALVEQGYAERVRIGQTLFLSAYRLAKALGLHLLGRGAEALEACREAAAAARSAGEEVILAQVLELEARIRCEGAPEEELAGRVAEYEAALGRLEAMELGPALARGRRFLGGFLGRLGEGGRARALEAGARAYLRAVGARDAGEVPVGSPR